MHNEKEMLCNDTAVVLRCFSVVPPLKVTVHYASEALQSAPELTPPPPPQVLDGPMTHARFGWALQVLDYNLDGIDDLAVAAPTVLFHILHVRVACVQLRKRCK